MSQLHSQPSVPAKARPASLVEVLAETPQISSSVISRLPAPILAGISAFTESHERDVFVTAALGVLSGALPKVRGEYDLNHYSPHLFVLITAPAASGKGVLRHARRLGDDVEAYFQEEYQTANEATQESQSEQPSLDRGGTKKSAQTADNILVGQDLDSRHLSLETVNADSPYSKNVIQNDTLGDEPDVEVAKGASMYDVEAEDLDDTPPWWKSASKSSVKLPLRRLFLPGDISSSALILFLEQNGRSTGEGFGIVYETEIDTVVKTQKQDWGGTSDTLRKAHAHEPVSYLRVGDKGKEGEARSVEHPTLAVVIAGTPKQVLRMIPSTEDGLFSRFLFYGYLPRDPQSWKDVRPRDGVSDPAELLKGAAGDVRRLWTTLEARGTNLMVLLQDHQWDKFNIRMGVMKERLFEDFSYSGAAIANRAGLHVFRIAMTLAVWKAFEEEVDLSTASTVIVTDEDFETALALGHTYTEHAAEIMRAFPREEAPTDMTEQDVALLQSLPMEFMRAEAVRIGGDNGISTRTLDRKLTSWEAKGKIKKLKQGVYQKISDEDEYDETKSPFS